MTGFFYLLFLLGVSMFLAAFAIRCANEVFAVVQPDRSAQVAGLLDEAGVIEYPLLFRLYCTVSKATFKTGKYEVNANLDYSALARRLRTTSTYRETVRVTVPEGYTVAQIVQVLVDNGVCDSASLYDVMENYEFDYTFLTDLKASPVRLEGYLFPDTYEFYKMNADAQDKQAIAAAAVGKFLDNFAIKYDDALQARAKELGLTARDIVIIASMIEREARMDNERTMIASVIYNRLANPKTYPYLQIDATVQYLVGRAPTADDLRLDDPYNTYLYPGLPPGAICNPGLASLRAALYPDETDYFFYVARSDGSHVFSRTLEEHNAAIASVSEE